MAMKVLMMVLGVLALSEGQAGHKSSTTTVKYKPYFDHPQEPVYIWAGETRNITCVVSAEPEPTITWYRLNRELKDNGTYRVYNMYKSSNLQVSVQEGDQSWIYGEYTCIAINNLGSGQQEIELRRARVPGTPKEVRVTDSTPTSLELTIEPPEDKGGMDISGYRIEYEGYTADFINGHPIMIENLRPSTAYVFRIRAMNEVGMGNPILFSNTMDDIRAPYPIVITSNPEGQDPHQYTLHWEKPRTGGLHIVKYKFRFRRVSVHTGMIKPEEDWIQHIVEDDPARPMLYYHLKGLTPSSTYEVEIRTYNYIGWSLPNTYFIFTTENDPDSSTTAIDANTLESLIAGIGPEENHGGSGPLPSWPALVIGFVGIVTAIACLTE